MPLVAAKCTECGGVVDVDSMQEAAVCMYCKTPFIVEQAINNYHTTVNINEGGITADTLIEHAKVLIKSKEFQKANEICDEVLKRAPHDHRAYWGKFLARFGISDTSDLSGPRAVIKDQENTLLSLTRFNISYFQDRPFKANVEFYESKIANLNTNIAHLEEEHKIVNRGIDFHYLVSEGLGINYSNAMEFAPENEKKEYTSFFEKTLEQAKKAIEFIQIEREKEIKRLYDVQNYIHLKNNIKEFKSNKYGENDLSLRNRVFTYAIMIFISLGLAFLPALFSYGAFGDGAYFWSFILGILALFIVYVPFYIIFENFKLIKKNQKKNEELDQEIMNITQQMNVLEEKYHMI